MSDGMRKGEGNRNIYRYIGIFFILFYQINVNKIAGYPAGYPVSGPTGYMPDIRYPADRISGKISIRCILSLRPISKIVESNPTKFSLALIHDLLTDVKFKFCIVLFKPFKFICVEICLYEKFRKSEITRHFSKGK